MELLFSFGDGWSFSSQAQGVCSEVWGVWGHHCTACALGGGAETCRPPCLVLTHRQECCLCTGGLEAGEWKP